jgi:NAD(P)-dependent dehydrogenase (short-subunit alcohol dehydrogenase family)
MSIAVIQGASGGLGLGLTRHILAHTSLKVYALTHSASSDLQDKILENAPQGVSERLTVLERIDVREERGLEDASKTVQEREGKGSVRLIACLAGIVCLQRRLLE